MSVTRVKGIKNASPQQTPLGMTNFTDNLRGPRVSINSLWSIYSSGRITAALRSRAAGA